MYNGMLFLLCLSMATSIISVFMWLSSRRETNALLRECRGLKDALKVAANRNGDPKVSTNERVNYLERENSVLRTDVATGCDTIKRQIDTINQLRKLLHTSQAANKRLK